ncbi:MAG: thiolase family protein [Pseudomonadota bacterium]|nr:thiolase family protein [Pseudomonadota bacterium]
MNAVILAGRRTPVAVRNGAYRDLEVWELAAPVVQAVLGDAGLRPDQVNEVILGNALYGGGNPARMASLAAGLPESIPALSVDTQCCSGIDAIALAAAKVCSGMAEIIIAGGVESYSRGPIRQKRPLVPNENPIAYDTPPFSPWPERDPDMIESAAALAAERQVYRSAQEFYAVESHRRTLKYRSNAEEIVELAGLQADEFTRRLTPSLCSRLKPLAGTGAFGVTAATTAVEGDGAAVVIVASQAKAAALSGEGMSIRIIGAKAMGGDTTRPALAAICPAKALLSQFEVDPSDVATTEMMEAFAVQAMLCIEGIGLDPQRVNPRGGALAWGHPIGASGAILAVRAYHALRSGGMGDIGLAAIAAAGGLGSALLLRSEGS